MEANLLWLEDPEVFQVNRLEAHSDHCYYETEEELQTGEQRLRQSLNGEWGFCWSRNPGERTAEFYKKDADLSKFGSILVPGHIELQGYDQIQYINTTYPWEGHSFLRPPHIDWEYNPVGSYIKEFDLKKELRGKRVCISFQGVEQAMYVWLNGVFIGYAEDSFTPSEFDLTDVIQETDNRLCVEVYKRSSAAWLEDQDFFRFSGIFREVYLYAKPEVHIEDLWIRAGLADDYSTGELNIRAKVSGEGNRITWELRDRNNACVCSGELSGQKEDMVIAEESQIRMGIWSSGQIELSNVHPWSMKTPNLYRLYLHIYDRNGEPAEIVPYQVGFRRFEIKEKVMVLNGERIIVNGVNRHEWNPRRGRAITEADMRADIAIMKRNNINAVRTCHYPNQSLWYQLCDEAGICVMDETNMESHGSWQKQGKCEPSWNVPGSREEWKACVLDRAASMFERDKNHPSILWWSCGNESYMGEDILAMSGYFREKDPGRLVHYEGVTWNREYEAASDVESRMYETPWNVRAYLEKDPKKPFLMCEYMHDMGNSIGGMESYIKLLEEFPMYQGGFIWDYIDQALYYKNSNGEEVLGYGGDFGDRPTDMAFSANGIVFADRTEKPAMQEVRFWYSAPEDRCAQKARNEYLRTCAEEEIKKRHSEEVSDAEYLQVIHSDLYLGLRGSGFHMIFSWDGGPISIKYDGKECLYRCPKPAFWRASTENDKGNGFAGRSGVWMAADQFSICTEVKVEEYADDRTDILDISDFAVRSEAKGDIEKVKIFYRFVSPAIPGVETTVSYLIDREGRIKTDICYHGNAGLPELPLFGLRFVMPEHLDKIVWQGLSGETYPDRMAGGRFGIHEAGVRISDYLVPQENQNHMDTCWVRLGVLKITMDEKPFHFSAIPYTPLELENALHKEELSRPLRTVVTVCGKMRGVGGIDSWGADVESQYRVNAENVIKFSFYLERA